MEFKISNINKIDEATINLDGLTVIVGENSSGKSTIGRVLFSAIQAVKNSEITDFSQVTDKRMKHLSSLYSHIASFRNNDPMYDKLFPLPIDSMLQKIIDDNFITTYVKECNDFLKKQSISPRIYALVQNDIASLLSSLDIKDKDFIIASELQYLIESEFENRINGNPNEEASLNILDGQTNIGFEIKNNALYKYTSDSKMPIIDATYIESPLYLHLLDSILVSSPYRELSVKDDILKPMLPYHILDFARKINSLKYITKPTNNDILKTINSIINGHFVYDNDLKKIIFVQNDQQLETINVASGIKSFGTIQMLLNGDYINEKKMLIWDEPENHLHPEWQVKFANILVLLSKIGIPILVTTHSPYFLQAIRYFSSMYGIEKFVNYYSPKIVNNRSSFTNVNNNLNEVFATLASPLNEIMNVDEVRNSKL